LPIRPLKISTTGGDIEPESSNSGNQLAAAQCETIKLVGPNNHKSILILSLFFLFSGVQMVLFMNANLLRQTVVDLHAHLCLNVKNPPALSLSFYLQYNHFNNSS
jgi:hypothetical protein